MDNVIIIASIVLFLVIMKIITPEPSRGTYTEIILCRIAPRSVDRTPPPEPSGRVAQVSPHSRVRRRLQGRHRHESFQLLFLIADGRSSRYGAVAETCGHLRLRLTYYRRRIPITYNHYLFNNHLVIISDLQYIQVKLLSTELCPNEVEHKNNIKSVTSNEAKEKISQKFTVLILEMDSANPKSYFLFTIFTSNCVYKY